MKGFNFILFFIILYFSYIRDVHCCVEVQKISGTLTGSSGLSFPKSFCWSVKVPKGRYVTLTLTEKSFHKLSCDQAFIKIQVAVTNQTWKFCDSSSVLMPMTALNNVTITAALINYHDGGWRVYETLFKLHYSIEDIACTRENHFRCSEHSCVDKWQVCNGLNDCEDGRDENGCGTGIAAIEGLKEANVKTVSWLKDERTASFGWRKETHRAITALYLAGAIHFNGSDLEEELMVKQLELQTSVALLRNSTDPLSPNDISMFINALTVTCRNPRHFYGHDLLQILHELIDASKSPTPGAYLTLCNANWTLSEKHLDDLLKLLNDLHEYPFMIDLQAMAMMALTCIKNKMENFGNIINGSQIYNATIEKFVRDQLPDGSFGNIYTTALVTQALIASGQENNELWNVNATMQYLMRKLNSSKDFISVYLTLPILNAKSLADIAEVKCNSTRKRREDAEIVEIRNRLGGKMRVKYSLYIGDNKDVIHTISLRAPEGSTVYDIMRLAEIADHKYKFLHRKVSDLMYIYEITGIINDPEAGKFWLLYIQEDPHVNGTMYHHTKSPDKIILENEEHLIMWYKTVHI